MSSSPLASHVVPQFLPSCIARAMSTFWRCRREGGDLDLCGDIADVDISWCFRGIDNNKLF
jgi:hypothetical protein